MNNPGVLAVYLATGFLPILLWFWPAPLEKLAFNASLAGFLRYVPALALAGAGYMGWKLNQTRVLVGSFLFLALYFLLLNAGPFFGTANIPLVQDAVAVSLPLALALAIGARECPFGDRRFIQRFLLVLLPFLVIGLAAAWDPAGFRTVNGWSPAGLGRPLGLSWLCLTSCVLYGVSVLVSRDQRIRGFAVAIGLSLVPVLFALRSLGETAGHSVAGLPDIHVTTAFLAVSAVLFHSVFSMYWHRVYMDDLTGIPNRRALEEDLQGAGDSFAVAMIDIDHFKAYNDRFGHEEGDNVLRMVACHLERSLNTRVYRYGGEEFCALWRNSHLDAAFRAMEKARSSLEERVFHVRPPRHEVGSTPPDSALGVAVGVTISAGLATASGGMTPEEVLRKSDEALYEAKRSGRNRTVVSPAA